MNTFVFWISFWLCNCKRLLTIFTMHFLGALCLSFFKTKLHSTSYLFHFTKTKVHFITLYTIYCLQVFQIMHLLNSCLLPISQKIRTEVPKFSRMKVSGMYQNSSWDYPSFTLVSMKKLSFPIFLLWCHLACINSVFFKWIFFLFITINTHAYIKKTYYFSYQICTHMDLQTL